ncbi:phosphotransferase [Aestuariibacter sp. A3R04]|uniref:phosphotransferase n=1 Tax=Aestuariibacter sp. A3R04 TaxID=2841571 RepID=UPI001C090F01|nr:phosphotransferase [Aestuariibacter sp. A3R04]
MPSRKLLLDVLTRPLGLSDQATLLSLRHGAVNTVYKLSDGARFFAVKVMGDGGVTGVDHEVQFALQKRVADKKLAPTPVWLSPGRDIWVEQWVSDPNKLSDDALVSALAYGLCQIHQCRVRAPALNLAKRWRRHIQLAKPVLPAQILRQAERLIVRHNLADDNNPAWVLCHNDLSFSHILDAKTPLITDWEYAALGNRYFDLAASAHINGLSASAQHSLFSQYADLAQLPKDDVLEACKEHVPVVEMTAMLWQAAIEYHRSM